MAMVVSSNGVPHDALAWACVQPCRRQGIGEERARGDFGRARHAANFEVGVLRHHGRRPVRIDVVHRDEGMRARHAVDRRMVHAMQDGDTSVLERIDRIEDIKETFRRRARRREFPTVKYLVYL